jgi:two-component system chemotaxis response regulator CheB
MVVDDSKFMRMALRRIIQGVEGLQVCAEASNGEEAVRLEREMRPDLITMDVNMPVMDGLEATRRILAPGGNTPSIIMVSAVTKEGTRVSVEALRAGAVEVVAKGSDLMAEDIGELHFTLQAVLRAHAFSNAVVAAKAPTTFAPQIAEAGGGKGTDHVLATEKQTALHTLDTCAPSRSVDLIVIGASTGGPRILGSVLCKLPKEHPPVVIAQHLPAGFTQSLADSLARELGRRVEEAGAREILQRGQIVLVPGGVDATVASVAGGGLFLKLMRTEASIHPSVNLLLESAALTAHSPVAVVLTGMGQDGAAGALALRKCNAPVLVQTPSTCAVSGMPEAVIQQGGATAVLSLEHLATVLGQWSTWPLEGRFHFGSHL